MDSYLSYARRLTVLNQGTGRELFLMPLAACVDHAVVARICEYDLGKPFEEVSEDDWRAYFQSACGTIRIDMEVVAQNMKSLAMNTKFADAESRVGRLLADFHAKLEEIDMTDLPEVEPKACIKILVAAIRPTGLKVLIEKELQREGHGRLKKDVVQFTHWLRRHVDNYLPYESLAVRNDSGMRRAEGASAVVDDKTKRDWKGQRGARVVAVGVEEPVKKNKSPANTTHKPCLKCGGQDHRVFQCPKVAPGEAKKLLDAHFSRKDRGQVVAVAQKEASFDEGRSNKVNAWVAETGVEARSIPCTIGGLVATAMLDSGADQSLACPNFLKRLEAAGQWVPIRKLKDEVDLGGFQEGLRVKISHEVKLDLMFSTYAGDLVLRNVVCWVAAKLRVLGLFG